MDFFNRVDWVKVKNTWGGEGYSSKKAVQKMFLYKEKGHIVRWRGHNWVRVRYQLNCWFSITC